MNSTYKTKLMTPDNAIDFRHFLYTNVGTATEITRIARWVAAVSKKILFIVS